MDMAFIIRSRLFNQQISESRFSKPDELVNWMVAMQAQEFAMAKWAIGLRLKTVTESDIDQSFNEGRIEDST